MKPVSLVGAAVIIRETGADRKRNECDDRKLKRLRVALFEVLSVRVLLQPTSCCQNETYSDGGGKRLYK